MSHDELPAAYWTDTDCTPPETLVTKPSDVGGDRDAKTPRGANRGGADGTRDRVRRLGGTTPAPVAGHDRRERR